VEPEATVEEAGTMMGMDGSRTAADHVVDIVWSRAVDKIAKGEAPPHVRSLLGDELDIIVPQMAMSRLLSRNPAFARLLYTAAYTAAKRNAYITMRRLGMPADFFWKFDHWDDTRAFETLEKVLTRIFSALMSKHGEGFLSLTSLDTEHGRFELSLEECPECAQLGFSSPVCFFHAGMLAGIVSGMLDRDLDGLETECAGGASNVCRFLIAPRSDRAVAPGLERLLSEPKVAPDMGTRLRDNLAHHQARPSGDAVDLGYYQMLLSTWYLTNRESLAQACIEAGNEVGMAIAEASREAFPRDVSDTVTGFYEHTHHMRVAVTQSGSDFQINVEEAPEVMGPMAGTALFPFLEGELGGLLSGLVGRPYRVIDVELNEGQGFIVRLTPEV
jgi:predicted hydrocarbon binding protein